MLLRQRAKRAFTVGAHPRRRSATHRSATWTVRVFGNAQRERLRHGDVRRFGAWRELLGRFRPPCRTAYSPLLNLPLSRISRQRPSDHDIVVAFVHHIALLDHIPVLQILDRQCNPDGLGLTRLQMGATESLQLLGRLVVF